MEFPEIVIRIAQAVREQGGTAHVVGGSVRDMLLGLPSKDSDIEVFGLTVFGIEEVMRVLKPDWIDTVDQSFEVLKVRFGETWVDVSMPRRESKTAPGHRGFEVSGDSFMSPEEAARRRDFTINSMAVDPLTGEILDFFAGKSDIDRRILRATDFAKFREDPLRVLRAVQFVGRFGFMVEPSTLGLCREIVREKEFADLSSARIGKEWRKLLLKSERPSLGLEVGLAMGVWHVLHPELINLIGCPQDPTWHPEGDAWVHTLMTADAAAEIARREELTGDDALVILVGALCHDFGKPAVTQFIDGRWRSLDHEAAGVAPTRSFLARMEFGKDVEDRVVPLVADHLFPSHLQKDPKDARVRRLAGRLAPASIRELLWVAEADHRGRDVPWDGFPFGVALLEAAERLSVVSTKVQPILMGRHLISELGWKAGKHFRPVLDAVFEAQLEGSITTLEQALEMAKMLGEEGT